MKLFAQILLIVFAMMVGIAGLGLGLAKIIPKESCAVKCLKCQEICEVCDE